MEKEKIAPSSGEEPDREVSRGRSIYDSLAFGAGLINIGGLLFNLIYHGGIFGAPTAPPTQPAPPPVAVTPAVVQPPAVEADDLHFAGLSEIRVADNSDDNVAHNRARYLRDSAELRDALRLCHENPEACHPNVQAFADMLEQVALIKDKKTQVSTSHAWVNLAIDYDDEESAKTQTNDDHRSLLQTVKDRAGICDEQARLNLFILEQLGYPNKDMRWVSESVYKNNELSTGHAVTLVRIDDTNWVLDNRVINWVDENQKAHRIALSDPTDVEKSIQTSSTLYANWQVPSSKSDRYLAASAFNAEKQVVYDIDLNEDYRKVRIPATAVEFLSLKKIQTFDLIQGQKATLSPQILRILEPAMATKYEVAEAFRKLASRATQKPLQLADARQPQAGKDAGTRPDNSSRAATGQRLEFFAPTDARNEPTRSNNLPAENRIEMIPGQFN